MSKQAILPSPNWFLNSIADCSPEGTLAYGSRNGIVLVRSVDINEGSAPSPNFALIPSAHRDKFRVTAVSWSTRCVHEDLPDFVLASAGDDNAVAVWDPISLELVQKHAEHRHTIIGLDWSKAGDLLLVSADEKGHFAVWDLARNELRVLPILTSSNRLTPNVIKCSPVDQDIVAAGCKDGLVCIINLKGSGSIISRLRGHDKAVNSLSWLPDTKKLASSGLDQNIIVWSNGQAEKTIQLPNKSLTGVVKVKPGEKSNATLWSPVLFLKPDLIISGCSNAEVLAWNPTEESPAPQLLHSEHLRGLFSLSHTGSAVWSMAQDRMLVHHDLATKNTSIFQTLGGFAYCIVPCPFAPGRVAVGAGDESIRVWSLTDSSGKSSVNIWQRIKGKVLSLAWHPEKEGELAFATSEGRVGICNASNASKEPLIMRQFHRSGVYRVAWGPPVYPKGKECPSNSFYLYACDENTSVMYLDSGSAPTMLKTIIRSSNPRGKSELAHKDLAWKPDGSLMALGLEDGSIQLLTAPHLECVHTLLSHRKMILYLAWHPSSTAVDAHEEQRQNWLASTSMDQQVLVFDVSSLQDENKKWQPAPLPLKPMTEVRHGGKVVCLAWNPHVGGQLLSSSYDASVKVWNAASGKLLSCFVEHNGCVMSCCWSAIDPDIVISGSADFTCRTWKVSETPEDNKPAARAKHREEMKGETVIPFPKVTTKPQIQDLSQRVADTHQNKQQDKQANQAAAKASKVAIFPLLNASLMKNSLSCCYEMLNCKGMAPPEKRVKLENGNGDAPVKSHKGFFDDQEAAISLLDQEAEALKKMNNYSGLTNLKIWQGDLQQIIKDATKAKKLDDWLVSISPSVSHKFWMETCSAYADQLVEEEKIVKATSYFVMAQRPQDAILSLQKHKFFKEAVAMCHLRLSSDDPLLHQTLKAWGDYSHSSGNYEIAIQCYIAVGDYEKAAVVLGKRKDPTMWQLGIHLAKLAKADELSACMTIECFNHFLTNQDWAAAKQLVNDIPDMKHFEYLLQVHELVCAKDKEGLDISKVSSNSESILDKIEGIFTDLTEEQFLQLKKLLPVGSQLPDNRKELLIATSKLLLLAAACKASGGDDWERFVVQALHLNYRRSLVVVKEKPLHMLLSWLKPGQVPSYKASEESFRAAAYIGCINKEDTELFPTLQKFESALLDTESARFACLDVKIPDLEKKVAAAQVDKKDVEKLQEQLQQLKTEREALEKARVAFPNPFILFCKLQGVVNNLHGEVDKAELDAFESKMDAFKAHLQG